MAKSKLAEKGILIIQDETNPLNRVDEITNNPKYSKLREAFKAEVSDKEVTFPKDLGAEHPFDFKLVEDTVYSYGVLNAILDKTTNSIVGDFTMDVENENSKALLKEFFKDIPLHTIMKAWVKEALSKGNGFMQIDMNEGKLDTVNANGIYVKRDNKGKVLKYNQFTGNLNNFKPGKTKVIEFNPKEIAHLKINSIPDEPYGLGIVWPNMRTINHIIGNEIDQHKLIQRKAGAPLHIQIGQPGERISDDVITKAKTDMQYLTTRTEWASDANVNIKVVEIPELGKALGDTVMHDFRMLLGGTQMPEVLMGSGQLNEGIAKVQEKSYKDYIKSLRREIEVIIEQQIIRPFLQSNGFDEKVLFTWDLESEEEINNKVEKLNTLIQNPMISPTLKAAIEIEISKLLGFEDLENYLVKPEKAQEEADKREEERIERENGNIEREKEEEIEQPEVPGAKPNAKESFNEFIRKKGNEWCVYSEKGKNMGCYKTEKEAKKRLGEIEYFKKEEKHECIHCMKGEGCGDQIDIEESRGMTLQEWVNLEESKTFNYQDYVLKTLEILKKYDFPFLRAITPQDIEDGLLNDIQIEKLRIILKNGYKENQTIRQIEKQIESLDLPDKKKDGKITAKAENRPNMIARSETVRLSNLALLDIYKENKIDKVRFLSAISERTCPTCSELNGRVFNIEESSSIIPVHTSCRCTWTPVIE
jgi:SPP1 gp7 family putative phage head morphogenesis protein